MNKAHRFLAATLLLVASAASPAQETLQLPKQAAPPPQETLPAPIPFRPGAKESRPAPAETAPGTTETQPVPGQIASAANGGYPSSCASGCDGCHHLTCEQFKRWLFFCPQKGPGLCGCGEKFEPCCYPPLYTFFLCRDPHHTLPPYVLPAHAEGGTDGTGCGNCRPWFQRPTCCEAEQPTTCEAAGTAGMISWEEPVKSKK